MVCQALRNACKQLTIGELLTPGNFENVPCLNQGILRNLVCGASATVHG